MHFFCWIASLEQVLHWYIISHELRALMTIIWGHFNNTRHPSRSPILLSGMEGCGLAWLLFWPQLLRPHQCSTWTFISFISHGFAIFSIRTNLKESKHFCKEILEKISTNKKIILSCILYLLFSLFFFPLPKALRKL